MKSKPVNEQPGSNRRWWLTEGTGVCGTCEVGVHPEALGLCIVCDRGVCALCCDYADPTGPVLCPECAESYRSENTKGRR